jgi:adenylate cyclase
LNDFNQVIFFLLKYIMLKRILTSPWTALFTLAIVLGIRIADPAFVESVRLRYFDTLVTSKPAEVTGVHVVNIDEKALEQYGQFPFARNVYAGIIQDLYRRNAGLVVFNVLTPDSDRMGRDAAYVAALQKYPTVLPSIGSTTTRNQPRNPGSAVIGPFELDAFVTYPGIIANIAAVESAAAGVGITNTLPEIDGVVRRMPMVVAYDGKLYPSLAMEVMRVAAGDSTFQVKINESGVEKMRIPQFGPVSTDSLSRIWIDWSLIPERHSLTNLPRDFDGEIVIVGVSAAGLANPVATSLGEMLPQDLQAAVIGTVIANKTRTPITRPGWADGAEIVALAVTVILLLFLSRWTYVGISFSVLLLGSSLLLSGWLYRSHAWLVDATFPIAGLVLVLLHAYGVKFVSEFLQKQQIKRQFGSYVNPTIVERLQKDPSLIRLGGEKKQLSVVMTDMRNFTALGESYGEAGVEDFTQIMNSYMTALSVPILANNGTLIKFIGDASLHIHGAPLDDADHAYSAVKTALEMIEAVKGFNNELAALGKPPVGMGAGVNTGEILVGNIGAKTKFGYDVLGDPVSLAARLESQTKGYGVLMIISEATADLVRGRFPLWELDNIAVKGKTEPVRIFAIEEPTIQHAEFLHRYYAGDWTQALKLIDGCKHAAPQMEHYYDAMATRLEAGVPDNWRGYYVATAK